MRSILACARKRWFRFPGPNRVELHVDEAELRAPMVRSELIWVRVAEWIDAVPHTVFIGVVRRCTNTFGRQ